MSTIAAGTTSTTALVSTGDTTGKLTFQTNGTTTAMTIDTSQNVGIGTSSPSSKVEVVGTGATIAKVTNTLTSVSDSAQVQCVSNDIEVALTAYKSGGIGQVGTNSNHPFLFRTNSVERMRIDSSGNVGIRTNSPVSPLTVFQASSGTPSLGSATYYGPVFQNSFGGYGLGININSASGISLIQSQRFDGTATAYDIALNPLGGNVGIGTSTPTGSGSGYTTLHVNNATNGGQLHLTGGGSGAASTDGSLFTQANTELFINNQEAGPVNFYVNGSERMRIESSGSVAIGTTATAYGVSGSTPHKQTIWFDPASNYDGLFIACTASSGTAALFFSNTSGSPNQAGSISVSGATASYNSGSDYRMKENVKPMTGALEAVAKLKPVTFDWKDQFVGARKQGQGFLAHELAEVVPDCVSGVKDEVDANGRPKYQAVDTSFLVATLTAAIQELKAEVDALKAQLAKV